MTPTIIPAIAEAEEGHMYDYPVEITPDDNDTFMATVPDVPGVRSFGDTEAAAMAAVRDALESVLAVYIAERRDIPAASKAGDRPTVSPTATGTFKLAIYDRLRQRGWRKADLARAMAVNPRQVDRLLDLRHASTIAQLEEAMAIAGGGAVSFTIPARDDQQLAADAA